MDGGLPPDEADDAAVWDPSSGLPRECVEKPKPLIDPKLLQRCPVCEGDARCVPTLLIEKTAPDMVKKLMACDETSVCVPDADHLQHWILRSRDLPVGQRQRRSLPQ